MTFASLAISAGVLYTIGTFIESYRLENLEEIVLKEIEHCKKPPSFETLFGYIRMRNKWVSRENLRAALIRLQNKESIVDVGGCFCLTDA